MGSTFPFTFFLFAFEDFETTGKDDAGLVADLVTSLVANLAADLVTAEPWLAIRLAIEADLRENRVAMG